MNVDRWDYNDHPETAVQSRWAWVVLLWARAKKWAKVVAVPAAVGVVAVVVCGIDPSGH